jgi:replication factor A1
MNISELRPSLRSVELTAKIIEKNEPRVVVASTDNAEHKVAEVLAADETGSILLTLWDENIEKAEQGKAYKITNAYTSIYRNSLRLNLGKYGKIEPSTATINAKSTPNISEKEFEFGSNK